MQALLAKLFSVALPALLNWCAEKGAYLMKIFSLRRDLAKSQQKNTDQAEVVAKLAEEIQAYIARGEPVPKELKEKMREESKKLSNSSTTPSNS